VAGFSRHIAMDSESRKKDQQSTNRLEGVVITQPPMSTAAEPMISSESTDGDLENTVLHRNTAPAVHDQSWRRHNSSSWHLAIVSCEQTVTTASFNSHGFRQGCPVLEDLIAS